MIKIFRADTLRPRFPELQAFVKTLTSIRDREVEAVGQSSPRRVFGLTSVNAISSEVLELSPGLTVLTVPTRGGKTTFLGSIETAFKTQHPTAMLWTIAVDEPIKDGLPFLSARSMFATDFSVDETIDRLPDVILIDSLRLLPFELDGGLRSGAVAASLFAFLTELTVIASHFGIAIIAAFNPMVADTDKSTLDSDIESSTMAVAKLKDYTTLTYASRAAESRASRTIDLTSGVKLIELATGRTRGVAPALPPVTEVFASTAYAAPMAAASVFAPHEFL